MPKVSVIFEDNAVAVDGAGLTLASLPPHDASWRALQWDGARGHIEKQGGARQEFFTDAAIVHIVATLKG